MIAAPGGGKGTQGERPAAQFSVQHGMPRGGQRTRID
jgi:adenylate kinase family enzyme